MSRNSFSCLLLTLFAGSRDRLSVQTLKHVTNFKVKIRSLTSPDSFYIQTDIFKVTRLVLRFKWSHDSFKIKNGIYN